MYLRIWELPLRTTHFVGYLFWSYAHFVSAGKIESRTPKELRTTKRGKGKKVRLNDSGIQAQKSRAAAE